MGKKFTKLQPTTYSQPQPTTDSHTLITEESTIEAGEKQSKEKEEKMFDEISKRLTRQQGQLFGVHLGLNTNELIDLETEVNLLKQSQEFKVVRMIWKWKDKLKPDQLKPDQLVSDLKKALTAIGRYDIVKSINEIEKCETAEDTSSSNSPEISDCEDSNERIIFDEIAKRLSPEEWQPFGARLRLGNSVLTHLEEDSHTDGRKLTILRMLEKWKEKRNPHKNELLPLIEEALSFIKRNDIINIIKKDLPESAVVKEMQKQNQKVDDADLLKKIQEVLKEMFKDVTLPTSVWLDKKILRLEDLFVELTMKNVVKRGEEKDKYINKEEVFLETGKEIPRRILVEGPAGYGKTTLVAKFLSDWANGKKYLTDRFDLVFVIYLRYYTGNLRDHLLQHCERVKRSEENKMRVIESIKERVLLLLDGLDEIPSDFKEKISPLIMGDEFPEMTVVVTCRVGFLQLERKSYNLFQWIDIQSLEDEYIWDKRIKIEGVSPYKRKEFLQKYLNVNDEILREQLSQTNFQLNDLYACPLFLLLLAVLVQEKDIRPIKTKTELYKTIFNFVINRGLEKLKGKRIELDVFDLKAESDVFGCQNVLINFGRLCVEKMKKHTLIFEKSEFLKCSNGTGDDEDLILNLGFLSKQVNFCNYEKKEHYEAVHRSFLEFSAAYFLSLSNQMETEIQELVSKWNIWPEDDQVLYPFLGGLLHSNAFKMFNAFSAFKHLITVLSISKYNVRKVLLEIPETEENLKSLENLAIGNWDKVKYEESLHFWFDGLMKNRSEEIFLKIPENLDIINGVSGDIKVNTIRISVDREMKKENMIIEKNIHCQNLIIILEGFYENIPVIVKEMSMIKAEKVWLKIEQCFFIEYFGNIHYIINAEHFCEMFCEMFYENLRMTVDERLIEHFPEELVEGIGKADLYFQGEQFRNKMFDKIYTDLHKDNLVDWNEEIDVEEIKQYFGDEIEKKLGEEMCEKLNKISRDMLEAKLFEKFYEELNYIYSRIGQQYCRFFECGLGDLLNRNVCEILNENSGENADLLFNDWILNQMKDVLHKVVLDKVELDAVVFNEDREIGRKYKLLGREICIRLRMKKTIVDTLSEKIVCLIAIETVEKFDELVQSINKELSFLIKEYLDKPVKWLNEAELTFNIYHLSLSRVTRDVFSIVAPLIQDLIQRKKVEYGIKIKFSHRNINDSFIRTYNSFVEIVSNSHLKSIGVDCSFLRYSLPFPITLFNNEKQMEFIGLRGSFKGLNVDQMKSVSVDHFDCVGLTLREKSLLPQLISTFKNMKKLTCDCDLITDLGDHDSISEWKQLETIDQLEISIKEEKMENKESFRKGISLFHNVRELGLYENLDLDVALFAGFRKCNIGFVAHLPSLKKIHYYGEYFPNEFFKQLLDLKFEQGKRKLCLDAVEFKVLYEFIISKKVINDIELCFQKNIFHKFSIINYSTNDFGNVLKHFISKRAFKVYCQWKEVFYVEGNDKKYWIDDDTGNDKKYWIDDDTGNDKKYWIDDDTGNDNKYWIDDDTGNDNKYCIVYETDKVLRNQLNICFENVK